MPETVKEPGMRRVTESGSSFPGLETSNVAVCSAPLHSLRVRDELPRGNGWFWKRRADVAGLDSLDLQPAASAVLAKSTVWRKRLRSGIWGHSAGSDLGIVAGFIASSPELKKENQKGLLAGRYGCVCPLVYEHYA